MTSDSTTPQELPFPDGDAPRVPTFGASAVAPFVADIRQFATVAQFAAYLATLPPPGWRPIGSTTHNTYRPLASQWAGRPSMDSMVATYKAKAPPWDRGPHFYFVVGAPNPKNDGIWQMTPPSVPGIHAGDCNAHRFGCELVGDYQASVPALALRQLYLDGLVVLHRWARIGPLLNAHRDCMPGRTCPGAALYALMPSLQAQLAARLGAAPPPPAVEVPLPALWGPIATPEGAQWLWESVLTWTAHRARLGACRSALLYDNEHSVITQVFERGMTRQLAGGPWEVCYL